jgi:DNA (cytosine-5)-methyltransferase 1
MSPRINVIDLFAGPGGLGEGFSSFADGRGRRPFHVVVSAEMDRAAHATLSLRALTRHARWEGGKREIDRVADLTRTLAESGSLAVAAGAAELGLDKAWDVVSREALNIELGTPAGDAALAEALDAEHLDEDRLVLIGGPPCQAYSLAGRVRNRGKKGYKPEADERHFLYRQYLKILSERRPAVFVMENVKGILSSKVGGSSIFPRILDDLMQPGRALGGGPTSLRYCLCALSPSSGAQLDLLAGTTTDPERYIVRAEDFGVPQARHRVILVGVREDLALPRNAIAALPAAKERRSTEDALADLPYLRSGLNEGADSAEAWFKVVDRARRELSRKLRDIDRDLSVHLKLLEMRDNLPRSADRYRPGGVRAFTDTWYRSNNPDGVVYNHETRTHMSADLERYLYCSAFAAVYGHSPTSDRFPAFLAPDHANWATGHFADRFRVQLPDRPSSTVTSHISKDGHHFIHWDPAQCRSMTVREGARLQTFPDDYFFAGPRTAQFHQVGNAVPPYLAREIAKVVAGWMG